MLGWKDGLDKGRICFVYSPQLHSEAVGPRLSESEMNLQVYWGLCTVFKLDGSTSFMFSNLTDPCPHCRNFIQTSVLLGNHEEITNCEIILKTPPLSANTHLHSHIRHSSLNYPDPPYVYVSGAPHSAWPCA